MVADRFGPGWDRGERGRAALLLWPHARDAGAMLAAQDDPAQLADLEINSALRNNQAWSPRTSRRRWPPTMPISPASFVDLAQEKNIARAATSCRGGSPMPSRKQSSPSHFAKRFATGLVTGNADDVASLSGTVAGDLFVFGDIRDVVREGKHLAMGEDTDRLVLGLAAAGLAVTAATYVSIGGVAPVRAGLTLVKDARKVGRLGEGLTDGPAARRAKSSMRRCWRMRSPPARCCGPGETVTRDQGGVPCREGRRAGAPRQGCRARRREGRVRAARWIR